eukprot:5294183-Prymnesium_polylepis.1
MRGVWDVTVRRGAQQRRCALCVWPPTIHSAPSRPRSVASAHKPTKSLHLDLQSVTDPLSDFERAGGLKSKKASLCMYGDS